MAENLIREHTETAIPASPIIKCLASVPGGAEVSVIADSKGNYPDVLKAGTIVCYQASGKPGRWENVTFTEAEIDNDLESAMNIGIVKSDAKVYKVDEDSYYAMCDIMVQGVVNVTALDAYDVGRDFVLGFSDLAKVSSNITFLE